MMIPYISRKDRDRILDSADFEEVKKLEEALIDEGLLDPSMDNDVYWNIVANEFHERK